MKIDWKNAPDGATHYRQKCWYKASSKNLEQRASIYTSDIVHEKYKWQQALYATNGDLSDASFVKKPH